MAISLAGEASSNSRIAASISSLACALYLNNRSSVLISFMSAPSPYRLLYPTAYSTRRSGRVPLASLRSVRSVIFHVDKNISDHSYCLLAFEMACMVAKTQTNPRRLASQQRSRLTVEALLEATARILVKDGYDCASTNRIAHVAGVSIGSLYQYFPSKEALVAAVIDRQTQETMQLARDALIKVAMQPVEE